MYKNIGSKLKALAKWCAIVGIIAGGICGLIFVIASGDFGTAWAIVGLAIMILGPLFSWIGGFFIYGFGELIEKTDNMEREIRNIEKITKNNHNEQIEKNTNEEYLLKEEFEAGKISEEEYVARRKKIIKPSL